MIIKIRQRQLFIRSISFLVLILFAHCDYSNNKSKIDSDLSLVFKLLYLSCHKSIKCVPDPFERGLKCKCNYVYNEIELIKLDIKVILTDKDSVTYLSVLLYDEDSCCRYQKAGVKKYGYKKKDGFFPMDYGNAIIEDKYNFNKYNTIFYSKIKQFNNEIKDKGELYYNFINEKHFGNKYPETYKNAVKLFNKIL